MRLATSDEVISLSILHRVGTTMDEREAYLRAGAVNQVAVEMGKLFPIFIAIPVIVVIFTGCTFFARHVAWSIVGSG